MLRENTNESLKMDQSKEDKIEDIVAWNLQRTFRKHIQRSEKT